MPLSVGPLVAPAGSWGLATLDHLAVAWLDWVLATSWQVTVVVAIVAALDRLFGRRWLPQFRYGLWMLVALKLLLPPSLPSPVAVAVTSAGWLPDSASASGSLSGSGDSGDSGSSGSSGGGPSTSAGEIAEMTRVPLVLFGVWVVGFGLAAGGGLLRTRSLRRRLSRETNPAPEGVIDVAERVSGQLGLARLPEIRLSHSAIGPFVIGWRRPMVVLPKVAVARWSANELTHVLGHELAHVERGDLHAGALFAAVNALFWFHPLIYWARLRAHAMRELCCDATVARVFGDAYRKTLVRAAAESLLVSPGPLAAAFGGRSGRMIERLRALEGGRPGLGRGWRSAAFVALVAFAALSLPLARPAGHPPVPAAEIEDSELAEARRAAELAIADGEGIGSLHARYTIMRLNALEAARAAEGEASASAADGGR